MPQDVIAKEQQPAVYEQEPAIYNRSPEIVAIMGRVPGRVTRQGTLLVCLVCVALLLGAVFFRYPDVIQTPITIYSDVPPVQLVSAKSLAIQHLFVQNGQQVKRGAILCVMNNAGDFSDIMAAKEWVTGWDTNSGISPPLSTAKAPVLHRLGELQYLYDEWMQAVATYLFFLRNPDYRSKIKGLSDQAGAQATLSGHLMAKTSHLQQQLEVANHRYQYDSILAAKSYMSALEYEKEQTELLNKHINLENNYGNIMESVIREKAFRNELGLAAADFRKEDYMLRQKINDLARQFAARYVIWEQDYVWRSPVDGKVTFFKFWKENQFVTAGEPIMIVSAPVKKYLARGTIDVKGSGKVRPGQKAVIKLSTYPYLDYGSLKGKLNTISNVSLNGKFAIEIFLGDRLVTTAGKNIPNQPLLEGVAEIETDNKSILQRLFQKIIYKE